MPKPIVTGNGNNGAPLEAFVGDVVMRTFVGEHLDTVTDVLVAPVAKDIKVTFGDPLERLGAPAQRSPTALTITFEIGYKAYPGEKRVELISPEGNSNPVYFLLML